MSRDRDTVVTGVTSVQAGKGPAKDTVLLGKYRVEGTLGFGGMGLVIRAHNMAMDEHVAIKFLREDVNLDSDHVERFLREAKAAVRLKSEHVAKIRDVGTLEDGRPYMVMELLEGLDLGRLLIDHGSIEPKRAVDMILQACDALAEAHALGIIHRDIKPTNLFVTRRRDDSELLKVLDFGISKALGAGELSLTQTSSMLGTPAYMSPEQMRSARTADPRSDIWALGTVLYELVEGHLPFEANNFAELCVIVSTEPPGPMTKAPHLQRVITRCLAKPIEQRYQDVGELALDLEPYASEPGLASRQVARIQRVLGTAGPRSRDSTPLPMSRDSMRMEPPTRDSIRRIAGLPETPGSATRPVMRRSSRAWKSVVLLLLLFAVGIAAGLYVTSDDSSHRARAADGPHEDASVGSVANGAAASGDEPTDGSVTVDAATSKAGSAESAGSGSGSGSGNAAPSTTNVVPPKKPPPRKLPPRRPPSAGSGAPKKCDPYDNPKGCN